MPRYGRPPQVETQFPSDSDFKDESFILKHIRKSRWLALDIGNVKILRMNWLVSLLASLVLWGFVLTCIIAPESTKARYQLWQSWITQNLTWFYIFTNDVWAIFLIWLCVSKYGKLKLGKDDSEPQYSYFTWFTMLFTCGVAVGVYTWGVSEPMYYYRSSSSNYLFRTPHGNDDERAQQAITVLLFHWGLHGYVVYSVVALLIGFVSYRWGLPMTIRSCFYPLLGDVVFGVLGDCIDALSIACTTFGVCTSLGFGASVMNAGLHRLNSDIAADSESVQVVIILVVTALATVSVVSGLDRGIKHLSYLAFVLGVVFMLLVLFFDNTWYLLNAYVQSVGHYIQYIVQLGFFTDAYAQLAHEFESPDKNYLWGAGREVVYDKIESIGGFQGTSAEFYQSTPKDWMDWWTVFYWGWWITWCPFVGMFIARISRGRTIRSVVFGTFFAPVIFLMLWLTIMGALGIKMERIVELATGVKPDVVNGSIDCSAMGYTDGEPTGEKAIELANLGFYAIACRPHSSRTYDVLESYGDSGMNTFLVLLVLGGIFIYFITSSDSGSMVDDILSASGLLSPPPLQKIYWSFTEGATAIALLVSGGTDALSGLQAASICAGLPYTIALCFMCVSLLRAVRIEYGDKETVTKARFNTGILDVFEGFNPTPNEDTPILPSSASRGLLTLRCFVDFFTPTHKASSLVLSHSKSAALSYALSAQVLMGGWILFLCLEPVSHGMAYIGWIMYIFLACHLGYLRMQLRERYDIIGSFVEDVLAFLFLFPFALAQMQMQTLAAVPAPVSVADVSVEMSVKAKEKGERTKDRGE